MFKNCSQSNRPAVPISLLMMTDSAASHEINNGVGVGVVLAVKVMVGVGLTVCVGCDVAVSVARAVSGAVSASVWLGAVVGGDVAVISSVGRLTTIGASGAGLSKFSATNAIPANIKIATATPTISDNDSWRAATGGGALSDAEGTAPAYSNKRLSGGKGALVLNTFELSLSSSERAVPTVTAFLLVVAGACIAGNVQGV